jgi:hypothetical protein
MVFIFRGKIAKSQNPQTTAHSLIEARRQAQNAPEAKTHHEAALRRPIALYGEIQGFIFPFPACKTFDNLILSKYRNSR